MKKILSILLTAALSLGICASLSSCNKSQIKVNPDKEKYTVGILQLGRACVRIFKSASSAPLGKNGDLFSISVLPFRTYFKCTACNESRIRAVTPRTRKSGKGSYTVIMALQKQLGNCTRSSKHSFDLEYL